MMVPADAHAPGLDAFRALLAAARTPGTSLVIGAKDLGGGWYETRPAVLGWDEAGALLVPWVGSRHLAIAAVRQGLFAMSGRGRALAWYDLTAEGRSLARDLAETAGALLRRIRDLEAELVDLYATVDASIEASAAAPSLRAEALGAGAAGVGLSLQAAIVGVLIEASGQWVTGERMRDILGAQRGQATTVASFETAVYKLRRRGWQIESRRHVGYRMVTARLATAC